MSSSKLMIGHYLNDYLKISRESNLLPLTLPSPTLAPQMLPATGEINSMLPELTR